MQEERTKSRRAIWIVAGVALVVALVWPGTDWGQLPGIPDNSGIVAKLTSGTVDPLLELFKLVTAALIGLVVTSVHNRSRLDRPSLSRPLAHAQILFCVAGALVIIIIGNSLPRAFGAFGIASIIRFRTPLKNPKDAAVLFLLVGLGMASGAGMFAVAGLAALFFCFFLLLLNRIAPYEKKLRSLTVGLEAEDREFPGAYVEDVFASFHILFEPREISLDKGAVVKYHVLLDSKISLGELNTKLMDGGASGIKSVAWEPVNKCGCSGES